MAGILLELKEVSSTALVGGKLNKLKISYFNHRCSVEQGDIFHSKHLLIKPLHLLVYLDLNMYYQVTNI